MTTPNHPAFRLAELPPAPVTLSEGGKQEWSVLMPIIYDLCTARPADVPAIEMLCEIKADIRTLEARIHADGILIEAGSGGHKTHPAQKSLETARSQAKTLMDRFGLLPDVTGRRPEEFNEHRYANYYAHD